MIGYYALRHIEIAILSRVVDIMIEVYNVRKNHRLDSVCSSQEKNDPITKVLLKIM